jgi:hypothetical protein
VPLLLRTIRKSRWNKDNFPWLTQDDIQADLLIDLVTSNNTLSVWLIQDDKSNLNEVITALASNRDTISNLDYAIFDISLLESINIKLEVKEGNTLYDKANRWHRDLIELTVNKIVKLAESMLKNSSIERVSEKKILNLIKGAVDNGQIDKEKLKPSISNKVS